MVSKINLKARIERHSRILKDNLWNIHPFRTLYHRFNYNVVLFLTIFLFPIYPLFSSFFYNEEWYDFYRWDIDESSIIDSYIDQEKNEFNLISWDSYLSINTLLDEERNLSWFGEIIEYEVKSWDSIWLIANNFWISLNSILWANNFDSKKILHPWEKIKVLPVSWLIHKVKTWDTITQLAVKYKVDEKKVLSQNSLNKDSKLIEWTTLVIPWAIKEIPKPKIVEKPKTKVVAVNQKPKDNSKTAKKANSYSFVDWWNSEYVNTNWSYELVKRTPKWKFYWGNCTWYVAQYKWVDWSWDAKYWLANAKAKWHDTWKVAWVWAIVVFNGKWYNPRYGHVWIVIDVTSDSIIVKDMNYRRLNEVTVRKIPKSDRAIQWYIYVD